MSDLMKLVSEWNWDFDPTDESTLDYAEEEIASFMMDNQDDTPWLVDYLRPYIRQCIIEDLKRREGLQ